ncbi:MAG: hypothetical protein HC860_15665 [Alkalinema sp. RU_4_3]|nr:hypothetical protein [Alkalinema sp. RU_4_3]
MRLTQYHFIHLLSGLVGAIGCLAVEVRAQSLIVPDNTLGVRGRSCCRRLILSQLRVGRPVGLGCFIASASSI